MPNDPIWKKLASRYLFSSQWYNVRQDTVELPSEEQITYTLIEHPGSAMVVAVLDDGRIILEQIYRYTVGKTLLECPSGGIDGEQPRTAAERELEEETGWVADHFEELGTFCASSGISDETLTIFLATGLHDNGTLALEATEHIELVFIPLAEAAALALAGKIEDAPTALALILAQQRLDSA